jgi:homoaconitate hydratase
MGSVEAKAYLASPEVVAASALAGKIAGPGWYERPAQWAGVVRNAAEPVEELPVHDTLANVISKLDSIIETDLDPAPVAPAAPATPVPAFPPHQPLPTACLTTCPASRRR